MIIVLIFFFNFLYLNFFINKSLKIPSILVYFSKYIFPKYLFMNILNTQKMLIFFILIETTVFNVLYKNRFNLIMCPNGASEIIDKFDFDFFKYIRLNKIFSIRKMQILRWDYFLFPFKFNINTVLIIWKLKLIKIINSSI